MLSQYSAKINRNQKKEEETKMENIQVQKRDFTVKAKKLRRLGMVPGSVFGKSLPEAVSIQIEESIARKLVQQKREGSKLTLDMDGQIIPVQIKEKTMNTLNNEIVQLSFQALTEDEKVNSVIHLLLTNDDKVPGQLERMLIEVPYASLPKDMIDTITLDLDGIKRGESIMIKDIPELMNGKIDLQIDPDDIVVRVTEKKQNEPVVEEE